MSEQDRQMLEEMFPGDVEFEPRIEPLVKKVSRRQRFRDKFKPRKLWGSVQSDEVLASATQNTTAETLAAENMVFHDAAVSQKVDLGTMSGGNYDQDADSAAELGSFLSRPVRIGNFSWTQGGGFFQQLYPWASYFNDPLIKNKLQNYGKISCRLHLKFMINASPFHYGSLRACYFPLQDQRANYITNPDLVPFSQVPGVYIEPQNMTTAEMVVPFLWPHNWLEVTALTDFIAMGTVELVEYAELQSANGATSGATVLVYAWAEDVKLMGPTTIGALQSDEYEDSGTQDTISGPATAVANIASKLTSVPFIGDFAKATEMGANMVAGVSRLFGYSNPPVIDDVMPFQPKSFHAFANSETRMPIDKLSLDPKNEVTISSSVAGVDEDDPLVFNKLLTHDSFILATSWTGALAVDSLLYSAIVNPHYASLGGGYRTMPPVTYFSPNFRYWRGSLVYKFRFIKTRFHKGRVLISFDPNGDISGTTDTETTTFSRVVDIEQEDEVEFIVPYKATSPLLDIVPFSTFPNTISSDLVPVYTYDSTFYNGTITMRVQTSLTGPTTSSNITILTYVKAGEDFVFAGPRQLGTDVFLRDPAGVIQSDETPTENLAQEKVDLDTHVGLITTGEVISSMRPLLHRTHYCISQFAGDGPVAGDGVTTASNNFYKVPPGLGRGTVGAAGYNWANSAAPYAYFFTANNPIDWTLDCFVAFRGSTNLHVNAVSTPSRQVESLAIHRRYAAVVTSSLLNRNGLSSSSNTTGLWVANLARSRLNNFEAGGGVTLTNPKTQSACSANLPQYWPLRFNRAFHTVREDDPKSSTPIHDNYRVRLSFADDAGAVTASTSWPIIEVFASAGVDFAPIMYLCTPRVFTGGLPNAAIAP